MKKAHKVINLGINIDAVKRFERGERLVDIVLSLGRKAERADNYL